MNLQIWSTTKKHIQYTACSALVSSDPVKATIIAVRYSSVSVYLDEFLKPNLGGFFGRASLTCFKTRRGWFNIWSCEIFLVVGPSIWKLIRGDFFCHAMPTSSFKTRLTQHLASLWPLSTTQDGSVYLACFVTMWYLQYLSTVFVNSSWWICLF